MFIAHRRKGCIAEKKETKGDQNSRQEKKRRKHEKAETARKKVPPCGGSKKRRKKTTKRRDPPQGKRKRSKEVRIVQGKGFSEPWGRGGGIRRTARRRAPKVGMTVKSEGGKGFHQQEDLEEKVRKRPLGMEGGGEARKKGTP